MPEVHCSYTSCYKCYNSETLRGDRRNQKLSKFIIEIYIENKQALSSKKTWSTISKTKLHQNSLGFNQIDNFLSFPSFRIGSTAQKKNLETPEILNSLNAWNFLCQPFKDSTCICQNNDFKTLNSSKTQIN